MDCLVESQYSRFYWDFLAGRLGQDDFERLWPNDESLVLKMHDLLTGQTGAQIPALTLENRMNNVAIRIGIKASVLYTHNGMIPQYKMFLRTKVRELQLGEKFGPERTEPGQREVDPGPTRAFLMYKACCELTGFPVFRLEDTQALLKHGKKIKKYESSLDGLVGAPLLQKNLLNLVRNTQGAMAGRVKTMLSTNTIDILSMLPPKTLEHLLMFGLMLTTEHIETVVRVLQLEYLNDPNENMSDRVSQVGDRVAALMRKDLDALARPTEPVYGGVLENFCGSEVVAALTEEHRRLNRFVTGDKNNGASNDQVYNA